ncbi:hypothetical protein [Streptomyces sp. NPDC093707]|uniref:hypothetical protein n=1 Tax=Streptomyces sp. NPDC093707 TaxID=3154984 RepID=UPI00344BA2BF
MKGDRHPKADIEAALKRAEKARLKVTRNQNGHRWGFVICCPCNKERFVWSTPANTGMEAKRIDEFTRRHSGCA